MSATPEQVAEVLDYIDNEEQCGNRVEPDEVLDVLRSLDDHPRNEDALKTLATSILSQLLEDGAIVAYSGAAEKGADGAEWGVAWQIPEAGVVFGLAPRPKED